MVLEYYKKSCLDYYCGTILHNIQELLTAVVKIRLDYKEPSVKTKPGTKENK